MSKREAGTQGPLAHLSLSHDLSSVFDFNLMRKILGDVQEGARLQISV